MDRINASNPMSISAYPMNRAISAYTKTPPITKPAGSPYATQTQGVRRADPATTPETAGKISPSPMDQRAGAIGELVGAKVKPIDLSSDITSVQGPKPVTTSAGTYTMFAQPADRVQAATGVQIGRSLDIKG